MEIDPHRRKNSPSQIWTQPRDWITSIAGFPAEIPSGPEVPDRFCCSSPTLSENRLPGVVCLLPPLAVGQVWRPGPDCRLLTWLVTIRWETGDDGFQRWVRAGSGTSQCPWENRRSSLSRLKWVWLRSATEGPPQASWTICMASMEATRTEGSGSCCSLERAGRGEMAEVSN